MRRLMILSLSLFLLACGSNTPKTDDPVDGPTVAESDAQPAAPTETPEQKFARQQADTVSKMCERTVDCTVLDARANAAPEELAKIEENLEAITGKLRGECESTYPSLSPAQVIGIRGCLGEATQCPAYFDCLAAAGKRK